MKKLFIICFISMLFCSCDERKTPDIVQGDTQGTRLVTLSINGYKHEFVTYTMGAGEYVRMGIAHWPECEYCPK